MRADANFDNSAITPRATLVYDPGRAEGSPVSPPMNGRAWGVLVCGADITDALFPYDTAAFYRESSFAANALFKGRRYTFQINDPKKVTITVTSTAFTPFITIQRTVGMVKQATNQVVFEVTEATSGEYAVEVSSVEQNRTGVFNLTVECEETGDELCGIASSTTGVVVPVAPETYDFTYDSTTSSLHLFAVQGAAGLGVVLYVNGTQVLDYDYYPALDITHFWFREVDGRNNCAFEAAIEGTINLKHWSFKQVKGTFSAGDPREEASQSVPGQQCITEDRDWTAGDVYLIVPRVYTFFSNYTTRIDIINTATSAVVATSVNGIFVVPATATYRIELLDIAVEGGVLGTVEMNHDCWVQASKTVDPTSGDHLLTVNGTNTSIKKSTLTWGQTAWYCYYDDLLPTTTSVLTGKQDWVGLLSSCSGNEGYNLQMEISDESYRADATTTTAISVAAVSVNATPIAFDATFVALVNAHKDWFACPSGTETWDGTLPRFETLNGSPVGTPYYGYAADLDGDEFLVAKECAEHRGIDGFQWSFRFYLYADGVLMYSMRYTKDVISFGPAGSYTLDAWAEDPYYAGLPTTITIS